MNVRLRQVETQARKRLGARSPKFGMMVARWSVQLAAAGVRTPVGTYDSNAHELVFQWVEGTSGREMVRRRLATPTHQGGPEAAPQLLPAMLRPLACLHRVDRSTLQLERLDPWRRIRCRLVVATDLDPLLVHAYEVYDRLRDISDRLSATAKAVPVHGDFHIGQLLFERASNEPWLLDLDDLSLGPREHDIGNFAAHLATSGLLRKDFLEALPWLEFLVRITYEELADVRLDPYRVRFYSAVTLLRRALKFREQGHREPEAGKILCAAYSLAEDTGHVEAAEPETRATTVAQ